MPNLRSLSQLPNESWIENIAIRPNGQLLVTDFSTPNLYQIDSVSGTSVLVGQFPNALGLLGITELQQDVFAVAKGIFDPAGDLTLGSFSIWKADFRAGSKPALTLLVNTSKVTMLNGLTTPGENNSIILAADSLAGVVWRINIQTGATTVALNDSTTQPIGTLNEGGFGVDGVRFRSGFLYYTNTNKGFYRVAVHNDGAISGKVQQLANFTNGDDFAFDKCGNAFISQGGNDQILIITGGNQLIPLTFKDARNAAILLEGNTAMQFGRTSRDSSTLYVTTNGGIEGVVSGTPIRGGRVLAVELKGNPWCA
jgi:hypothetical protein